jgi:cyclopropane-fatty-acyl-phospholipid synthase
VDDLTALIRIMVRNESALGALDGPLQGLRSLLSRLSRWVPHNPLGRSRRDVGYHYDLSNEFFATFLCRRMMYSAALFETDGTSLEEASAAKIDRVLDKLTLSSRNHLLEVGSGWGSLAIEAAQRYGCRVTTTTISQAQFRHVRERVARAGLEARVRVLNQDYRALTGRFDRIVSVEMVEAVGHRHLDGYFARLGDLLTDDGLMVLQAITIRDSHYRAAVRSTDFIKKHIFPGSFIPSVSRLVDAAAGNSATVLVHLEDLGHDYALTLRHWRQRCEQQAPEIDRLGFDERFRRMWRFYLAYCEGAFLERRLSDVQMLFTGAEWRGRVWRGRSPDHG